MQGEGQPSPFPLSSPCRRGELLPLFILRRVLLFAHRFSAHLDTVGVVNQTVRVRGG